MAMTVSAVSINQRHRRVFNRAGQLRDLEARVARLERYLETQHTITRIIASSSGLKTALPQILQAICETADWDFGEVWYVSPQNNRLYCESTWRRPSLPLPEFENSGHSITFSPGKGLPGRVWASGEPAWVPNVVSDKNFMRSMIAEHDGLRAGIAIPVCAEGAMIGTLTFFSRESRPIDRELLHVLQSAGNQIGLFIQRKRAEQEEREKEWLLAALQERQRLARDLHDSVTQTLFSASVMAEMLPVMWANNPDQVEPRLREVHHLTREALGEMRSMVSEMRSPAAQGSDLTIMLNRLAERLQSRTDIAVHLDINLPFTPADTVQMTLYRIAQESLNNIAKHAEADQVWVRLHTENDSIALSIRDNGRGFELSSIPMDHFGVAIMRERAESIGSTLQIDSALGQGTCISIYTPLIA